MQRRACCIFDAHSRLLFISVGAAFLAMPGDKQAFAFFLMLPCWGLFCCDSMDERPLVSLLMLTHQDDGPRFGLGRSVVQIIANHVDTLISEGHLLRWWISLFHGLFWSEVSHSSILIKYQYKTSSEAAPCTLQPCYFNKWDIFANTSDCQYAMGFPVFILNNFLPIFPFSCHLLMSEWDSPMFDKLICPKTWIPLYLYFSVSLSNLVCNY